MHMKFKCGQLHSAGGFLSSCIGSGCRSAPRRLGPQVVVLVSRWPSPGGKEGTCSLTTLLSAQLGVAQTWTH